MEKVKKTIEQDEMMIKSLIASGMAEDSNLIKSMRKVLANTKRTIKEIQSNPLPTIIPRKKIDN